jgi:hypothetical protein
MRRTHQSHERSRGLGAAAKAGAIVLAVAVLAVVAEQPIDLTKDVPGASGTYTMPEPARDIVPLVGVDVPMVSIDGPTGANSLAGSPKMLATAPVLRDERRTSSGVTLSPTATTEDPVATF